MSIKIIDRIVFAQVDLRKELNVDAVVDGMETRGLHHSKDFSTEYIITSMFTRKGRKKLLLEHAS